MSNVKKAKTESGRGFMLLPIRRQKGTPRFLSVDLSWGDQLEEAFAWTEKNGSRGVVVIPGRYTEDPGLDSGFEWGKPLPSEVQRIGGK